MSNDLPKLPAALSAELARAGLGEGRFFTRGRASRIPATGGCYLLFIHLPRRALVIHGGPFDDARLAPGWLIYAGSARGAGGLRSRLSRHMRREKKIRWHIDHLTSRRAVAGAMCFTETELDECELASRLTNGQGVTMPLPGFGASDCRSCRSHLLHWRG